MAPHRSTALRILVAAGDRVLARRLFDHLGRLGHALVAAPDGPTALHLALRHDYDAILLDAALPQLDGYAVCRHLREASRHEVPVLMLTARGDATEADLRCGADEYLRKPLALVELDHRLEAAVRRVREPPLDYDASFGAPEFHWDHPSPEAIRAGTVRVREAPGRVASGPSALRPHLSEGRMPHGLARAYALESPT